MRSLAYPRLAMKHDLIADMISTRHFQSFLICISIILCIAYSSQSLPTSHTLHKRMQSLGEAASLGRDVASAGGSALQTTQPLKFAQDLVSPPLSANPTGFNTPSKLSGGISSDFQSVKKSGGKPLSFSHNSVCVNISLQPSPQVE
jgi:hypothetical protein